MRIPKPKQEHALQVAVDLVSTVPLREIWSTVASQIDHQHVTEIAAAIDPSSVNQEKRIDELIESFVKKIGGEHKAAFLDLQDAWMDRLYWRHVAGFYLGVAVAMRFNGEEVSRG